MHPQKYVKVLSEFNSKYDWIESCLLEIKLEKPEDFLKIKETLTRIGISSRKNPNTLFQSCHILHKKIPIDKNNPSIRESKYFICHFKELFVLDGKPSTLTDEDIVRRNKIAKMLQSWSLVKIVNPEILKETESEDASIKIISHKDKKNWNLVPKYNIGNESK
jgi:hypothetical protein